MNRLMEWFRLLVLLIPERYRAKHETQSPVLQPSKPAPAAEAAPSPEPLPPPPLPGDAPAAPPIDTIRESTTPEPAPVAAGPNRRERRRLAKWERERRKHDVLVTPKAPDVVPPRKPRMKTEKKEGGAKVEAEPEAPVHECRRILMEGDDGKVYAEEEIMGEFTFRDTILEQLDMYWIYLRRMQQRDREAYEFYKRIGATIVPPAAYLLQDGPRGLDDVHKRRQKPDTRKIELTPWWKVNRPSFGCITYGLTKKVEEYERRKEGNSSWWVPKFFYFTKYDRPPPNVAQRSGGDTYKLTIWWDRPFDPKYNYKKGGIPNEYAVFLDRETIQVLPMLDTKEVTIRHKISRAHQHRGKMFSIPQRAWRLPQEYVDWGKAENERPEEMLARMFMDVSSVYERSNYSMVRVAVHNGDLTAQFSIDPRRMSYFFQDRDIVYTPGGAREHCFHIVRAHERHLASGKVSPVKLHFRGAHEFTWAGYRVTVTVPARDHDALTEFDVGVSDLYWTTPKERKTAFTQVNIAEMLQRNIEGEDIGHAFKDIIQEKKQRRPNGRSRSMPKSPG